MPKVNFPNFFQQASGTNKSFSHFLVNVPFDKSNKNTENEIKKIVLYTMASGKAKNKLN